MVRPVGFEPTTFCSGGKLTPIACFANATFYCIWRSRGYRNGALRSVFYWGNSWGSLWSGQKDVFGHPRERHSEMAERLGSRKPKWPMVFGHPKNKSARCFALAFMWENLIAFLAIRRVRSG